MNPIDENRHMAVQVLKSNNYEIDEHDNTILASKYCERGSDGVVCLLIEVTPPYNRIKAWGDNTSHIKEGNLGKLINSLNDDLHKLRRAKRDNK